jgi:aspartyl-tRNA(Asn)/glutamyl-tRNA(Gln) amidotransferase subunit C
MSLNINDIKRIAHLARIQINDDEAAQTLTKLSGIMGLIEQMQAVDTKALVQCHTPKMWCSVCAKMW